MKVPQLLQLVRKEVLLEFRAREVVTVMLTLSILFSVIIGFGVEQSFVDIAVKERLFAFLVWVAFIFMATLTLGKVHDYDVLEGAHEALLLSGFSAQALFLSKVIVQSVILTFGQMLSTICIAGMIGVSLEGRLLSLSVLTSLTVAAYTALSVLLAALTIGSRLRQVLLPLLVLPVMMPLFFAALEMTTGILLSGQIELSSPWFVLLMLLEVLYFGLGILLYQFAVLD
jgi:heme exporter protein B